MSIEELKRQVWVLSNEKTQLQRHNERIEQRLNEYVKWSEQAQKTMEENKIKIVQLTKENTELVSKVGQGTVAMSQTLLDENSSLKRQLQDYQEQFQILDELINPLVMKNLSNVDHQTKRKLINAFNRGTNERKILSFFIENPDMSLSTELIVKKTGLSYLDCNTALKNFEQLDYIREIQPDVYQTIQAVGDKVISDKDLHRVSIEVLHQNIKDQINKSRNLNDQINQLERYANELKHRNQTNLTQEVYEIIGDLQMAKRSPEWIIDKLEEIQGKSISGISSGPGHIGSLRTQVGRNDPAKYNVGVETTISFNTNEWKNLSNGEVIEKVKVSITAKTKVKEVIEILTALKNHLETSVSGRTLYNINQMISEIRKNNDFNKDEIHETLFDLSFKV